MRATCLLSRDLRGGATTLAASPVSLAPGMSGDCARLLSGFSWVRFPGGQLRAGSHLGSSLFRKQRRRVRLPQPALTLRLHPKAFGVQCPLLLVAQEGRFSSGQREFDSRRGRHRDKNRPACRPQVLSLFNGPCAASAAAGFSPQLRRVRSPYGSRSVERSLS